MQQNIRFYHSYEMNKSIELEISFIFILQRSRHESKPGKTKSLVTFETLDLQTFTLLTSLEMAVQFPKSIQDHGITSFTNDGASEFT